MRHGMTRPLRVLLSSDLSFKGIPWSRQHILRKIKDGSFPQPDGRLADSPKAIRFWFEETIDNYLHERVKKTKAMAMKAAKEAAEQTTE
jgi:hypothetical protein